MSWYVIQHILACIAACAPATGEAAIVAATVAFLMAVSRLSIGVYINVAPADAAIINLRAPDSCTCCIPCLNKQQAAEPVSYVTHAGLAHER